MANMGATIKATGLTRNYGHNRAVDGVNLTLHKGDVLGLLGANGAGKSTTLRMLTGALAADAGHIEICGHDLREQPVRAKQHLGYLPERPPLYPELTVNEYLRFCARLHGIPRRQRRTTIAQARNDCELNAVANRLLGHVSTGYQQRVGIAQAIIHRPDIIILDEPVAGLDPQQIRQIRALITGLADNHSVIVSSHILPEIQAVASRVMLMHRGRVALDSPMADIGSRQPGHLRLGLHKPPNASSMTHIEGVAAAQQLTPDSWRITPQPDTDPAPALARAALNNDWGLFELAREQRTLEELFIDVTSRDEALAQ